MHILLPWYSSACEYIWILHKIGRHDPWRSRVYIDYSDDVIWKEQIIAQSVSNADIVLLFEYLFQGTMRPKITRTPYMLWKNMNMCSLCIASQKCNSVGERNPETSYHILQHFTGYQYSTLVLVAFVLFVVHCLRGLIQIMACCRTGDKPLPEPMISRISVRSVVEYNNSQCSYWHDVLVPDFIVTNDNVLLYPLFIVSRSLESKISKANND